MSKGQVQLVSIVIIIVLLLAVIAMVLPWALTMIQKKKDMKTLDDVYNFFQNMDETIRNVARGGGEESLTLKVPGKFTIYPSLSNSYMNNSIVFVFESLASNIAQCGTLPFEQCWIPLNTPNTNKTATLGLDSPSVIFAAANETQNKLEIRYRLWYRTLNDTNGHYYKIILNTSGNTEKTTTYGFMRIQRIGSREIPSESLTITEINIIV